MLNLNTVYCLDNIELMKKIPNDYVDLIYSDILYGTGKDFGDFQDLKCDRSTIENHYRPRIKEMRRVLKNTGLIYLQMDFRINYLIRIILDDIFGQYNFRNEIIWSYNSAPRKKKDFGSRHDVIYRYSKTDNYKFFPVREPYSLSAPRGYEKEKYYHAEGKVVGDVWNIKILGQNDKTERVNYPTQKPLELAERIIITSTEVDDVVADFYMGSGTTLVAAKKNNRKYIGCDISLSAFNKTTERLK